jgi:cobalamin biosynthesis Mg chelatase CobN
MRQARKSRHHLFTLAAIAALVACAAIAPAIAAGDPGGDEYTLDVPGEGNTPVGDGSDGGDGGSDASSDVSDATATDTTQDTTTDSSGTAAGSGGGGGNDGGGGQADKAGDEKSGAGSGGSGGETPRDDLVASDATPSSVNSSGSDDGGVPVFLIVLAVLAAVCVAFAVWRMRRSSDDGDASDAATREVDRGAQRT